MYVYVWKTPDGIPFYVGMGKNVCRPSPKTIGHRNAACKKIVQELGADSVIIELHTVQDVTAAKLLEQSLIAKYGHVSKGTGTLTNKSKGGEFHETKPETKQKLKALWGNLEHREKIVASRLGRTRNLPESTKEVLRKNLENNPAMKGWSAFNGKDPEFDAKRIAGIKAAQPKRAEKMRDPEALAQRKARLKATLNSLEYKVKRALWDTPEHRAKQSAAKKVYWAKRKSSQA
jgi:hypothetical protein